MRIGHGDNATSVPFLRLIYSTDFDVSGPYQEFPLLKSGPYTGGRSPLLKKKAQMLTASRQDPPALTGLSSTPTVATVVLLLTLVLPGMLSSAALAPLRQMEGLRIDSCSIPTLLLLLTMVQMGPIAREGM